MIYFERGGCSALLGWGVCRKVNFTSVAFTKIVLTSFPTIVTRMLLTIKQTMSLLLPTLACHAEIKNVAQLVGNSSSSSLFAVKVIEKAK